MSHATAVENACGPALMRVRLQGSGIVQKAPLLAKDREKWGARCQRVAGCVEVEGYPCLGRERLGL